jgi:rRNA maturation RNase YbeY
MQNEHISFFSEAIDFTLSEKESYSSWVDSLIQHHNKLTGEISYIFCSDDYLHNINVEHLNHDTYTDIITFDYTHGGIVSGDIFISIDRVRDNAITYNVEFLHELQRVMAHGILHLIGFKDKTDQEKQLMRQEENTAILLFS